MIQNHTEEPCFAMYDRKISGQAYNTATDMITTSRVKKWKPLDDGRRIGACNVEYCYVDYDARNSNIDPMLIGQDCTSKNQFFENVPFITSVFEDSSMEKTRTFPYNKCVFKIDTSKATLENKQRLWDKVNGMHCDIQVADFNNEIIKYTESLKVCKEELSRLLNEYKRLLMSHRGAVATREKYEFYLETCRKRYTILEKELGNVRMDVLKQENAYMALMEDCKRKIPRLVESATYWKSQYDTLYDKNMAVESNLSNVTGTITKLNKAYEPRIEAYNNLLLQLETFKGDNKDLEERLEVLNDMWMKCRIEFNMCEQRLATCSNQYAINFQNLRSLVDSNNVCQSNLNVSIASRNKCTETNRIEVEEYKRVQEAYDKCSEELRQCTFAKDQQYELILKQSAYLALLKIRLDECMRNRRTVGELVDGVRFVKDQLETKQKQVSQFQEATFGLDKLQFDAGSAQLAACTGNQLPTYPDAHTLPSFDGLTVVLNGKEEEALKDGVLATIYKGYDHTGEFMEIFAPFMVDRMEKAKGWEDWDDTINSFKVSKGYVLGLWENPGKEKGMEFASSYTNFRHLIEGNISCISLRKL
jgi:hypothetical protein